MFYTVNKAHRAARRLATYKSNHRAVLRCRPSYGQEKMLCLITSVAMSAQERDSCAKHPATGHPSEPAPPKRSRCDVDEGANDDPAFFILFSGEDQIHSILLNNVPTPYQGAVPVYTCCRHWCQLLEMDMDCWFIVP